MLKILTVCTGNICRSPLGAEILRQNLSDVRVAIESAGTRAKANLTMTPDAIATGVGLGVPAPQLLAHRSRRLTEADVRWADLTLAMTRDHRREVVELAPSQTRRCFTAREFACLVADMSDQELTEAAGGARGSSARLASALSAINIRRGLVLPPAKQSDYDVVDPYRRSRAVYSQAASELQPALTAVERVVRLISG